MQIWIATTFAVVVATYAAGEKLPAVVRGILAVICTMAAAKLGAATYLRRAVMLSGSLLAIVFLFAPGWTRTAD